jgi:hypothetical protein
MSESIELIGGPKDGHIWEISDLIEYINIPVPPDLTSLMEPDPADVVIAPFRRGVYRRDVISDETHRWRYQWLGER